VSAETRRQELASVLLHRYGVLAREWYYHEDPGPPWREVFPHLERSEWRGELRRGHFLESLTGMQFALPAAVERLRTGPSPGYLLLNACDPANPYGPQLSPGSGWPVEAVIRRRPSNHVLLHNGICALYAEGHGARHWVRPGHESALAFYQGLRSQRVV
jgi:ATP-dependent Lhr-like helicase